MLGKDRLDAIAEYVLALSSADQREVLVWSNDRHLTRFAVNTIHQNVSETNATVRVRVVCGQAPHAKIGVASGNDLSEEGLKKIVEAAETVARFQQENPDFNTLPEPQPVQEAHAYVEATAAYTPEERAQGVRAICTLSREHDLEAAGAFSTMVEKLLVANSLGVSAYRCNTVAHLTSVVMGPDSSGYGAATAMDVSQIDPQAVGQAAVDKALRSREPADMEPGAYTVILEPAAVADMLFTLGYLGLGALAMQEGRSFMCGRLGEQITGENITIWDDGLDPRGLVIPFDFEGVPKQRVSLIENGVARGVVYDSFTAGREEGKSSTGHSLPAPNTFGPLPVNLFMAPGQASRDEMLASTERGIWVTRFHYTNPVHPVKTVLTGMTRDGTFLIENGQITRPLKNLRFTQSILEALAHVEMLSSELTLIKSGWGNFAECVPAAKINGFQFTGTTEF
ncbi:MAG TPA: TldD/PmbA family protein [Chloroflexi bacterium]|nr:TldD/PmbA family protein [Chloroflexota bacterium]